VLGAVAQSRDVLRANAPSPVLLPRSAAASISGALLLSRRPAQVREAKKMLARG
jgi:hypothetical protein